jgi:energy-coupling factor transport system ATP-binding protein
VACDAAPREFLAWATRSAPGLATPAARLFSLAGLSPPPASVREARNGLRSAAIAPRAPERPAAVQPEGAPAVRVRDAWLEIEDGPTVLRGLSVDLRAGERAVLMGRNGAGKSTLLRLVKGLIEPTRGRLERGGDVALLLQNPGDYLLHEHASEEAGPEGLLRAGLGGRGEANPRDLSGGERQRLALEVVLSGGPAAAVLLDEPTRGMDRAHKDDLARRCTELAAGGAAVLVATHDTEFAATFADRVVLLGQGVVIADGTPGEVLGRGWHFSTDVARITDGAALTPEQGAGLLRDRLEGALA